MQESSSWPTAVSTEWVVLVDEQDVEIGKMEKMEAHEKGVLHRAFSIFVFNEAGELLLQRRAAEKYHSALLWTNTCCSHPRPGETIEEAGLRRLKEELGFSLPLEKVLHFVYKAPFSNGLTEHEFDHVLVGYYGREGGSPEIRPNPEEVSEWKWVHPERLVKDLAQHPEWYTAWFQIVWEQVYAWWKKTFEHTLTGIK
jgi:isopentenyl-diphosphate delta-isomerase